jgi:hypothetical protein
MEFSDGLLIGWIARAILTYCVVAYLQIPKPPEE